jgi:hypothetical protein
VNADADADVNATVVHVHLPGERPPWTGTGLAVVAGDRVTLLGSGFVRWSDRRDIGAGAKYHLWGRVPGGEIFGCTQDTTTVVVDRSGELELCVYKGAWADRLGTLASGAAPYARNSGGLEVTVIRWPAGADVEGELGRLDHPLAAIEAGRLAHPVERPAGWAHLLDFGDTDIFRAATVDGRPAIEIVCDNDAGILQTPVDWPLTPTTTFAWRWKVDALPATEAEDTTWTHDYVSIATEFDDGRDLTWFWSAALEPVEATFACPVRAWAWRETHMPLRRGPDGLGQWQAERRNVWDDHARFMGDPPSRIVKVWLIAVSHFGRRLGRATFTDVELADTDRTLAVLSAEPPNGQRAT